MAGKQCVNKMFRAEFQWDLSWKTENAIRDAKNSRLRQDLCFPRPRFTKTRSEAGNETSFLSLNKLRDSQGQVSQACLVHYLEI